MIPARPDRAAASRVVLAVAIGSLHLAVAARASAQQGTWAATPVAGAPAARADHTAVWTGTAMVVWGGSTADGVTDSGGSYDPGANAWSATATAGAPDGRRWHTAVWTGSRMIVWGGWRSPLNPWLSDPPGARANNGGRYDPSAGAWTATALAGAPVPRCWHTAVWTGSKMIVWGGMVDGRAPTDTGGIYDPASDSWTATSTTGAPASRLGHTAVWTGSKMIVWGGRQSETGPLLSTGGVYDPATDTWAGISATGAPQARSEHTAVWTGSRMIVWGGSTAGRAEVDDGGSYDPDSDTWASVSSTNAPWSARHTAVWTGSRMIVWGGGVGYPSAAGGSYDPLKDTWVATTDALAPSARSRHTAVWTGSKMIVWGGGGPSDAWPLFMTGAAFDLGGHRSFHTLTPCRIADTRDAAGGPYLFANSLRTIAVAGVCGVPDTAGAVAVNVTVVDATELGDLRLWGSGVVPPASTINFSPGRTRANNAIVDLGNGSVNVACDMQGSSAGHVHVVLDVTGYFE